MFNEIINSRTIAHDSLRYSKINCVVSIEVGRKRYAGIYVGNSNSFTVSFLFDSYVSKFLPLQCSLFPIYGTLRSGSEIVRFLRRSSSWSTYLFCGGLRAQTVPLMW